MIVFLLIVIVAILLGVPVLYLAGLSLAAIVPLMVVGVVIVAVANRICNRPEKWRYPTEEELKTPIKW